MVEYISYKGEQLPIRISYRVIKLLKRMNIKIEDVNNQDNIDYLDMMEKILYQSLISGYDAESKELPFKIEDMESIMDESFIQFSNIIVKFFPITTVNESDEDKKKE